MPTSRHVLSMDEGLARRLVRIADDNGDTLATTLLKAVLLYEIAFRAKLAGRKVGIASHDGVLEREFVGI